VRRERKFVIIFLVVYRLPEEFYVFNQKRKKKEREKDLLNK